MNAFTRRIRPFVARELAAAAGTALPAESFRHLERAHVQGQSATGEHVRVHAHMLRWALRHRDWGEAYGQSWRMVGAALFTAFGGVPVGNTGGTNVSPFTPMPIAPDLAALIDTARRSNDD